MSTLTRERITEEIRRRLNQRPEATEAIRSQLRELIVTALELDYVSESCRGGIQTGNHYQSVRIGDVRTAGFRTDRDAFLDQIDFRGRTVLDLGANLGELSRAARKRGAERVVGIEYDDFFVAVADALSVFNDVDGVEFRQGDIGDPTLYGEHFDIVLAFSVFEYVHRVVAEVCAITDKLLVVETHKLDDNLESHYLRPIGRHLPSHRLLGRSDWGRTLKEPGDRAVVAFAHDGAALREGLRETANRGRPKVEGEEVRIDVPGTGLSLQERFFAAFAFDSADELFAAVRATHVDVETMAGNADMRRGYRGWLYWFIYLKGYLEYLDRGGVEESNAFCRYFTERHLPQVDEPGVNAGDAVEITLRRYRDLDRMRLVSRLPDAELEELAPVRITVSDPPPAHPLGVHLMDGEPPLQAVNIDGWHRLFAAKLYGIHSLPGLVVRERYPEVEGRIERLSVAEGILRLDGWCLTPELPWAFLELRAAGRAVGRVVASQRPDIARAYSDVPHASASGFSFTSQIPSAKGAITVDLLPMRDWLPIGRMRLHHVPEVVSSAEVAGWGEAMTVSSIAAAATVLGEAIAALGGAAIAERGAIVAVGPLQEALARAFLPQADVRPVGDEPQQWNVERRSCAVVAGGEVMSRLKTLDERTTWLSTAARALAPDGAVILTQASTLPRNLPDDLRVSAQVPPEPVQATNAVVLTCS